MKRALLFVATTSLAIGLMAVTAAALYLQLRNSTDQTLMELPAARSAQALVRVVVGAASPAQAQRAVQRIEAVAQGVARTGSLELATVIVEPRSTKYRFLRKRRYLAHQDSQRVGKALDRRSTSDKALYDLASRVRKSGTLTDIDAKDGKVTAAVPVTRDGKHHGTAVVVFKPPAFSSSPPAWPIAAWLLGCLLVALLAGFSLHRRKYSVLLGIGGVSLAAGVMWLQWVATAGHRAVISLSSELDAAIGTKTAVAAVENIVWWPLFAAAMIVAAICMAGWGGLGERMLTAMHRHRLAYSLLVPAGVGMLFLVLIPFGYGLALGFFNHAHGTYTYVGLSNFAEILGSDRPLNHPLNFYFTLGVTLLWTGVNVLLHLVIGLALALLLADRGLRFSGFYRALLILPWAIPNFITALIWKGMFHQQFGVVNQILELVGVDKISWFSSFSTAFCANVVTNTWLGFPFMMVVSLGALQSIPRDVYEAAAVDGASRMQAFVSITLPLLKPALVPAVILGSIWTFNMFNIIYLVSNGAPAGATDILVTEGYRWAFERDRYGLAAAYATLIFIVLLAYTLITRRVTRSAEEAHG